MKPRRKSVTPAASEECFAKGTFRLTYCSDWREAQSKEKERIAQASAGKLALRSQQFSKLNVPQAIDRYLEDRAAHVQPRSKRSESDHAKPIREYFASLPLNRVDAKSLLAYIRHRKSKGLSNTTVNMEIGFCAVFSNGQSEDNRWVMLAFVEEDKNWPAFARAIERPDLLSDSRFANAQSRHANSEAFVAELDRVFAGFQLAHSKKLLDAAHLP